MAIRGGDPSMWNCETVVRAPKSKRPLAPSRGAPRLRARQPEPPDDEAETLLIQKVYRPSPRNRTLAGSVLLEDREPPSTPDPIPPSARPVIWLLTAIFLVVIGCRVVPAAVDRVTSVTTLLEVR